MCSGSPLQPKSDSKNLANGNGDASTCSAQVLSGDLSLLFDVPLEMLKQNINADSWRSRKGGVERLLQCEAKSMDVVSARLAHLLGDPLATSCPSRPHVAELPSLYAHGPHRTPSSHASELLTPDSDTKLCRPTRLQRRWAQEATLDRPGRLADRCGSRRRTRRALSLRGRRRTAGQISPPVNSCSTSVAPIGLSVRVA